MPSFLLAIDQGTTSTRALAVDPDSREILAVHQVPLEQHYPANGWVEHDAEEIWTAVRTCLKAVLMAMEGKGSPIGVGITNQRETTVVWDKETGQPLHKAIVWQDRRTAGFCDSLRGDAGLTQSISAATGLVLDPYFSATKIAWLLNAAEGPGLKGKADRIKVGTIESYLIYRLTAGASHVTDVTNASRTMLLDIRTGAWSEDLLSLFEIPASILPRVVATQDKVGQIAPGLPGAGLTIAGQIGDQQSAALGQGCLSPGMTKSTYGTGCFLLINTGTERVASNNKLLTTIAYSENGALSYAVEGAIFNAGTVMQWLRDDLGLLSSAAESADLAASVPDSGGVYMVPAFTGLGAPYWAADARGLITGITRDTGRAQIVRAGLESVIYQTQDLLEALRADGAEPTQMRIDGGMAANDWFAQKLADLTQVTIERPTSVETTALGAALAAGTGLGVWSSLQDAASAWQADRIFTPAPPSPSRNTEIEGWQAAVQQCLAPLA